MRGVPQKGDTPECPAGQGIAVRHWVLKNCGRGADQSLDVKIRNIEPQRMRQNQCQRYFARPIVRGRRRNGRVLDAHIDHPVHQLPAIFGLGDRVEHKFTTKATANGHAFAVLPRRPVNGPRHIITPFQEGDFSLG